MPQTYSVLQVTPLPVHPTDQSDDLDKENKQKLCYDTIGGILCDTKYVWTANGPRFTLFNSKTGIKVAAWTFGSVFKDAFAKVTCIDELRRPTGKLPLLVIGLEYELMGGLICIFDVTGSRILRSIQIPNKVSSLHVIDASYDICPLPGPLRAFDGILSVGTAGGELLLLDICRQTCEEALNGLGLNDIKDEVSACSLKSLFASDVYSIELHKQVATKNAEHLCIPLNAPHSVTEHFVLKGPKGETRVYANKAEVVVSALHYCPQLGSLLVGYNFGAWQLWNLINLQLVYTSPIYEENIPVSHFAIQEPCDDPRAFCYVWAVYSSTDPYSAGFPVAVLYSLNYDSKEWHEGYGILYQDLTTCAVRFQMNLVLLNEKEPTSKATQQGARCLRMQAINKSITKGSLQEGHEETLTLCSIIWSGWSSDSVSRSRTYMSLFDLNQWYKEQMPSSPVSNEYEAYMTRVCLSDLLDTVNSECAPFLDVRIDVNTLSQFIGSQRLEEHYHPSSLAFQLCALRECDVSIFNNQGRQRSLLSQLECGSSLSLVKPTELFRLAINLGMSPLFIDIPIKSVSVEYEREFLLNIALEQQLLGWLCKCAAAWSNGSHSAAGCTLHFLVTWGWQRAQVLKQNADKLATPLFDYSGSRLDANTHKLLSNCARQLKNLATLFGFIVKRFARFLLNPDMTKQQLESLRVVSVHLEVLQWLLNVGLLPECPLSSYPRADEFNRINAPYPVDSLINYYNQRRTSLQILNSEQFSTSGSLLFIDNLIDIECGGHKLQKQWESDGGNGLYPPPSLQALLRTYLVENIDISFKHCVTVYVFLDLAMTLEQSRYKSTITHLIKFPAVFKLSPSVIKITQAFWQLDHGDFTTAMEQLLDPLVRTEDLKMWHHRVALKALLAQEQHNFALLYLQVRQPTVSEVQDLSVVLSLYVANNMLDEAFHFQRRNKSANNEGKLLHHFYKECDHKGKISSVLCLPLSESEETAFMQYLREVKHPKMQDLRVLYYVQNCRCMDAFQANNEHNSVRMENKGLLGQGNSEFRECVLSSLADAMPSVSKSLMKLCFKEKDKLWTEVQKPEPFSVFVHNTKEQVKYKSAVIYAGLAKAKEIWTRPELDRTVAKNDLDISKGMQGEEIPFLNTPKVMRIQTKTITPLIYPKITKVEETTQGDDGPTPPKRFKLSPRTPVTPEMQKSKAETLNTEVTCRNLSVKLDTPVIKRKTPKRSSRTSDEKFTVGTPQSILKIRKLVRNSESPDSAIDASGLDHISKTLPSAVQETSTNMHSFSPRKLGFGLSPRKPLPGTPRPAVRFDISRASSESSLTSNASEPSFKVIQEKVMVHSPLNDTEFDTSELRNNTQQSFLENSGKISTSAEEVYYTPDDSINSNVASKAASQIDISTEPESKILKQVLNEPEPVNVIMTRGRKSLIDAETKSPPKQKFSSVAEDLESITSIQETSSRTDPPSTPASPKTPRSRRSYKGILPEVGIRSSPRLRALQTEPEIKQLQSIDEKLELLQEKNEPKQSESKPTSESPIGSKLRGRRSLSRQVLEFNALSKLADSPVTQQLPSLIDSSTSQVEIYFSKTETSYKHKAANDTIEESRTFTKEENKDVFTREEQSFKHEHEESSSTSKSNILEEICEAEESNVNIEKEQLVDAVAIEDEACDVDSTSDDFSVNISSNPGDAAFIADSALQTSQEQEVDSSGMVEQVADQDQNDEKAKEFEKVVSTDNSVSISQSEKTEKLEEIDTGICSDESTVELPDDSLNNARLSDQLLQDSAEISESGRYEEPVSSSKGVSDDSLNSARLSDQLLQDSAEISESEKYEEPVSSSKGFSEKVEVEEPEKMNILISEPEEPIRTSKGAETKMEETRESEVSIYDDLLNDNYGSADPEMNVFEISEDLDLNQGINVENPGEILELDTNYGELFTEKPDMVSSVIEINDSTLEQAEELNKAIQDNSSDADSTEVIRLSELKTEPLGFASNEIIELDSSDDSEAVGNSEVSTEQSNDDVQSYSDYDEESEEYSDSIRSGSNKNVVIKGALNVEVFRSDSSKHSEGYSSEPQASEHEEEQSEVDEEIEEPKQLHVIVEEGSDPEESLEIITKAAQKDFDTILEQSSGSNEDDSVEAIENYELSTISEENSDIESSGVKSSLRLEAKQLTEEDSEAVKTKDENQQKAEENIESITETLDNTKPTTNVEEDVKPECSKKEEDAKTSGSIQSNREDVDIAETTATVQLEESVKPEAVEESAGLITEAESKQSLRRSIFSKTDMLDKDPETKAEQRRSLRRSIFGKTDILDQTPSSDTSLNVTYRDILDESGDFRPTSTPRPSLNQTDIFDHSEKDLKSKTPARRSTRLSSLQSSNTPDQILPRRITRRSASFSAEQALHAAKEPVVVLRDICGASELPLTSKQNQQLGSVGKAATPAARRNRSVSTDTKQLPSRKRRNSTNVDIEEKSEQNKPNAPAPRKRRAASAAENSALEKDEEKKKTTPIEKQPDVSARSTKSEGGRKPKPSTAKKSKSIILMSATKTALENYSSARRLTRRQASIVQKTLGVTEIIVSQLPENDESDSGGSEDQQRGPQIDAIDPIKLLDKPEFQGKPDLEEQKVISKSPSSSIPESPIGSRLRSRSSLSNHSPKSEVSVGLVAEPGPSKKTKAAKRNILEPEANIASRTRQRSKSVDEAFSSVLSQDKGSPPKLRRTRQSSKGSGSSSVSQRLVEEGRKRSMPRRKALSVADQPLEVASPRRRNTRTVKPELPKIIEEQVESENTKGKPKKKV